MFKPLEELLPITEWPALAQVAHGAEASGALRCICDVRCVDVDSYYRLSDERVGEGLSCLLLYQCNGAPLYF